MSEVNSPEVSNEVTPATVEKAKTRQMSFTTLDDGVIRAEFGEGIEPLMLNPAMVPESIIAAAVTEGLKSFARGYTSRLEGAARTPEALRERVAEAFKNALAGVWKIERAPGAGSTEVTIEIEAAALFQKMRAAAKNEPYDSTMEQVAAHWNSLTDDPVDPVTKKPVLDPATKKPILGQKSQVKALPRYQYALAEVKTARSALKMAALAKKIATEEEASPF